MKTKMEPPLKEVLTPRTLNRIEAATLVMDGTKTPSMIEEAPVLRATLVISSLAI